MDPPDFWGQLGAAEHEALIAVARRRIFPADSVLCTEGEPTTHVFVLLSGWVKCVTVTQDGRGILEALRGEGDVIGEIAGQVTGYRTATVQAAGAVDALIAGTTQFGDFLEVHPAAARAYRRYLAERHRAANELQRAHALQSGAQRLACLLLDLDELRARAEGGAASAPPSLSQEELASLIGGSRSTVTRALHDWRSRGIIGTSSRQNEILDRARLHRIAGRAKPTPLSPYGNPVIAPDARLVDAPAVKEAMKKTGCGLGIVVSEFVYETAVGQGGISVEADEYRRIDVINKEFSSPAWLRLVGVSPPARDPLVRRQRAAHPPS
jgi:CRP/FNR family transcriptional regulator, cyclic AMP receptor protein